MGNTVLKNAGMILCLVLTACINNAGDTTPPSAVADLSVIAVNDASMDLSWTSPGDDAANETAARYDLRYSVSPITGENWSSATPAAGLLSPRASGSAETFTVNGLSDGTKYYFALKTADEVPNWSDLSNVASGCGPLLLEDFSSTAIFPASNWWNLDISSAPVDPGSATYLTGYGANHCRASFGPVSAGVGYTYAGVPGSQALEQPDFEFDAESDHGAAGRPLGYPIPVQARTQPNWVEGGVPGGGELGDRHLILIDRDHGFLFETAETQWVDPPGQWTASAGAVWNLSANDRRPDDYASAIESGLALFPGLVRYDEAEKGAPIRHALAVSISSVQGYVWPASTGGTMQSGVLPFGARLRLKAGVDISGYSPIMQRVLQAMKTYGLIVAIKGSDLYVLGTADDRWDGVNVYDPLNAITGGDFELIELGWGSP